MPERGLASGARTTSEPASRDGVTRSATRVRGFADPEMDFQLLRSLGAASSMGAAVGEVLAAARNITDGEPGTWPPAFAALGDQTRSLAHSVLHKHRVSARDHFQRASMYYRAAEYYDDPVTETSRTPWLAAEAGSLASPVPTAAILASNARSSAPASSGVNVFLVGRVRCAQASASSEELAVPSSASS